MHAMKAYLPPLARLLMSSLFIWDGILQLRDPSGTAKYFANVHVPIPDVAVWISIVFHLLAGLSILVGFKIRWAAAALVVFCLGRPSLGEPESPNSPARRRRRLRRADAES